MNLLKHFQKHHLYHLNHYFLNFLIHIFFQEYNFEFQFISKYFNFVLNCSLQGKELCNDINEKNKEIGFLQKGIVPKAEVIFFGNK